MAVMKIQRFIKRFQKQQKIKKALAILNRLVLKDYFDTCLERFYANKWNMNEKKEDKLEQKEEREKLLRKLRPMKNRMLFFKNRTFKIDTLNRDIQWATERSNNKASTLGTPSSLIPLQKGGPSMTAGLSTPNVAALTQQHQMSQGSAQMGLDDKSCRTGAASDAYGHNQPSLQMVTLKKSDTIQPHFEEQLDQSKKASFLKREKARLTVREGLLFHYVKHGDQNRVSTSTLLSFSTSSLNRDVFCVVP